MNLKFGKVEAVHSHYFNAADCAGIARNIRKLLSKRYGPIVIVCIGTDRSTGDALGPLVGSYLHHFSLPSTFVFGTLERPVHAVNLHDTIEAIEAAYPDAFLVAVDACLGRPQNVGKICVSDGPVSPGAGVNKQIEPIGNMNITGVVNISGFMEYSVLQSTRLHFVMELATRIGDALADALLFRKSIHDRRGSEPAVDSSSFKKSF
ncbi:MAG: spore protease YyaC [Sporolactobacillus sp.]|jgi:putative sporulation protein YyaC|nr:spore protease YyaC [Sporolactobacillus sp.]